MKQLAIGLLAASLSFGAMDIGTVQSSTSTQNSQDVPHQAPGTNNPDLQPQHKPAPKKSRKSTSTEDVPHQGPGTNNPDVGSTQKPKPRKSKKSTATSTSTSSKPD